MLIINVSYPNDGLGDYLRTAFVKVNSNFQEVLTLLALKANLASPIFTGVPQAPTAAPSTNTNQLATTAFVKAAVAANIGVVTSVFGRTGAILPVSGDYNTNLVTETTNKRYQTDNQKLFNDATSSIQTQLNAKQATLVSGTNIKTVDGQSILGSGNLVTNDIYVTGGTYSMGTTTFRNNSGGTFSVSGFKTDDVFVTGGTYNSITGVATYRNNAGSSFNVGGFYTGGTHSDYKVVPIADKDGSFVNSHIFQRVIAGEQVVQVGEMVPVSVLVNNKTFEDGSFLPYTVFSNPFAQELPSIVTGISSGGTKSAKMGLVPLSGGGNSLHYDTLPNGKYLVSYDYRFDSPQNKGSVYITTTQIGLEGDDITLPTIGAINSPAINGTWQHISGVIEADSQDTAFTKFRLEFQLFEASATSSSTVYVDNLSVTRVEDYVTSDLIAGKITGTSFVKSGGTPSQYLMADGSTSTGVTVPTNVSIINNLPKTIDTFGNLGTSILNQYTDSGAEKMIVGTHYPTLTVVNNDFSSSLLPMSGASWILQTGWAQSPNINAGQNTELLVNVPTTGAYQVSFDYYFNGSGTADNITFRNNSSDLTIQNATGSTGMNVWRTHTLNYSNLSAGTVSIRYNKVNGSSSSIRIDNVNIVRTAFDVTNDFKAKEITGDKIIKAGGTSAQYLMADGSVTTAIGAVSSVFNRTGTVVAVSGDYNTNLVTESTNKRYQTDTQRTNNDATSPIQGQLDAKQAALVSGTNIKTVEGISLLGSGDINLIDDNLTASSTIAPSKSAVITGLNLKQDSLVSGSNIKTVGGTSILGSGNITEVQNSLAASTILAPSVTAVNSGLSAKQDNLVSNTNIKTVGGQTLLGAGNVTEVQNNLTASTVLAPSATAVNTALAGKQNTITNPVTGTGTSGKIAKWNSTSSQTDSIMTEAGTVITVAGEVDATKFVKAGGTASQYLMADGSVTTGSTGGGGADVFVTGGTHTLATGVTQFRNTSGGTFNVTGYYTGYTPTQDINVTGMTFNPSTYDLSISKNNGVSYTQNLGILASDMTITGGTYNSTTGTATFTNNSGGTFDVTGFLTGATGGAVASVFGRTGVVVATNGDYDTSLVTETTNKRYQTDNQFAFNDASSSIQGQLNNKQATLSSGSNIKTVGGVSILGSGNVTEVANDLTASTTIAPSKTAVNTALAGKQNSLVSGTSIKTVQGNSLLGSGDINLVDDNLTASTTVAPSKTAVNTALATKQDTLVSNTNIKTVGFQSILGSGNVTEVGNDLSASTTLAPSKTAVNNALATKQDNLVSGTNIKTIGGQSMVGSGDVTQVQNNLTASTVLAPSVTAVNTGLAGKQASLVSGTNIKTVNGTTLLGSGNIATPDTFVTGGTYSTGTLTLANNAGSSFNVSGFPTGTSLTNVAPSGTYPVTVDSSGNLGDSLIYQSSDSVKIGHFDSSLVVLNKDFEIGTLSPLTASGDTSWTVNSDVIINFVAVRVASAVYPPQGGSTTLNYAVPASGSYNISFKYSASGNTGDLSSNYISLIVDGVDVGTFANPSGTGGSGRAWSTFTTGITASSSIGIRYSRISAGNVPRPLYIDDLVISQTNVYTAKDLTAKSFIKNGGTSTQFLMADGSVSTGATGAVSSVFGRTGAISAQTGDYTTAIVADSTDKRYQTDAQRTNNDATSPIQAQINAKQATLVSGTSIKTVGGVSLLGSGNVTEVQNNLTASTVLAPSVTAVNTALAAKQNTITNPVTGTGTSGKIAKWNSASSQTDSIMSEAGTVITVAGDINVTKVIKSGGLSTEYLMADGSTTTSSGGGGGFAQIVITTSTSITTDTTGTGAYSGVTQDTRNVIIDNGANAINITVSGGTNFMASYLKHGTGNITFVAGSGRTLIQVDGTNIMSGLVGSTATISSIGTTDYLKINNR